MQQRHLRRVCGRLIVRLTSKQPGREENEKEERKEPARNRKKEEELYNEEREENPAEEEGVSNRQLSSTFIPPLTTPFSRTKTQMMC